MKFRNTTHSSKNLTDRPSKLGTKKNSKEEPKIAYFHLLFKNKEKEAG